MRGAHTRPWPGSRAAVLGQAWPHQEGSKALRCEPRWEPERGGNEGQVGGPAPGVPDCASLRLGGTFPEASLRGWQGPRGALDVRTQRWPEGCLSPPGFHSCVWPAHCHHLKCQPSGKLSSCPRLRAVPTALCLGLHSLLPRQHYHLFPSSLPPGLACAPEMLTE